MTRVEPRPVAQTTPFEVLARTAPVHPTSGELFATMASHIENQALLTTSPAILAINVGDAHLDDETRMRYTYLSNRGVDVFVLGAGLPRILGGRIRGIPLTATDPLVQERAVLFVGSRYGSGAFAHRRTTERNGATLDAGTSYDAERVIEAMLTLVNRLPS